ncbi:UbiX family flavin prenyltransferase [Helicobacter sp. 11S02629-2]|uniref:UbiX family flavin prenyltransferase n=1 Tax=Helicobacter sp. 11S02629-2 TaxID=1476195 RepID=UPI000BA72928|nr:UbiX family flavin prenyltransferase [Helicobacter sp. 11S02629-2]PAF45500.1 hypothetical protein BKH40_03295 [Helicobacter sp. 11S02629-2]
MELIIGVSGASGVYLSYKLLQALSRFDNIKVHLVVSKSAKTTFKAETSLDLKKDLYPLSYKVYDDDNLGASIASGTYKTAGMIVVPTSMKTLASLRIGLSNSLITRAADVCIKEGRKVVLVPREMPLSQIHLKNMYKCSKLGYVIIPPLLSFYQFQVSDEKALDSKGFMDAQINHILGKVLMQFNLDLPDFKAWQGLEDKDHGLRR